jgi:hypothetical protein
MGGKGMQGLREDYRFKLEVIYAVCGVNCVHGRKATKERCAWRRRSRAARKHYCTLVEKSASLLTSGSRSDTGYPRQDPQRRRPRVGQPQEEEEDRSRGGGGGGGDDSMTRLDFPN